MSRTLSGKTLRQRTLTLSPGPAATSTRQHTHVSPASRWIGSATRAPRSVTRASIVAAWPSRVSIQATSTVPSGATASPSKECDVG